MNGDKYEGKFINGLKNGQGTLTKSDSKILKYKSYICRWILKWLKIGQGNSL